MDDEVTRCHGSRVVEGALVVPVVLSLGTLPHVTVHGSAFTGCVGCDSLVEATVGLVVGGVQIESSDVRVGLLAVSETPIMRHRPSGHPRGRCTSGRQPSVHDDVAVSVVHHGCHVVVRCGCHCVVCGLSVSPRMYSGSFGFPGTCGWSRG